MTLPLPQIPLRFRPIADVVLVTGRPARTIRNWARDGRIDRMTHPRTGAVLVDLVAALELSQRAGRRNRSTTAAASDIDHGMVADEAPLAA
ncbi:hypothetical protein [Actinomadura luteofluorescens]|uniref:hypothetical protein n=1 Tax=Actinomadura luteofluorescens TaxID=46163 RepID=UPI003D8B0322